VTDCPDSKCVCTVATNVADNIEYKLKFLEVLQHMGSVKVDNLDGNTEYSFNLTCLPDEKRGPLVLKTKVGRPSAPRNILPALESKRVKLTWEVPTKPAGPIDIYRIKIDQKPNLIEIPGKDLFYVMAEDYVIGVKHTFHVQACNKNEENTLVCSTANDGLATFEIPVTTTTTSTMMPSPASSTKSMGHQSQGVSFALISVCLFFFRWIL
jgi:hypothetical protein